MEPLISVIVPIYKVENYLRKCVDSIISQTYRNLEIILVDDGSPDNCGLICDEYASLDSRIRVIHQNNCGQSFARNRGLEQCTGEYISFVDGDDYLSPKLYQNLMSSVPFHLLLFGCTLVDEYGTPLSVRHPNTNQRSCHIATDSDIFTDIIQNSLLGYMCNKIYHRSTIQNLQLQPLPFREDLLFNIAAIQKLDRINISTECGYFYVQRSSSTLHTSFFGAVPDTENIFNRLLVIHPLLSSNTNRKLSNHVLKLALIDFIAKYILSNDSLNSPEALTELSHVFSYAFIRKTLRPYYSDTKIELLLTICYKFNLPLVYYKVMKGLYNAK